MPNDDQTYVVIRVEMQAKQNWERSYEGFFDDDTAASGNASAQQSQKFDAIPRQTANGKYYPPGAAGQAFPPVGTAAGLCHRQRHSSHRISATVWP